MAPGTFPAAGASPEPERPDRWRLRLIAVAVVVLLALVGAAVALVLLRSTNPTSTPDQPSAAAAGGATATPSAPTTVTRCPTDPDYEVMEVTLGADGAEARVRVTPTCADGDVLAGASNLVTLEAPLAGTGASTSTIMAVAVFDMSDDVVAVPAPGTEVTFVFGPAQTHASIDLVDVEAATITVSRDLTGATQATASGEATRLEAASSPDSMTMNSLWLGLLQAQAEADAATVSGPLDGMWVAQLSSKRPGLIIDGITWDTASIWRHYLELKSRHPAAVLLYSEDWSVFDTGEQWWVIMAGEPFATADEANAWCDAQGYAKDDCFAKYLKVGGSSEGTTRLR